MNGGRMQVGLDRANGVVRAVHGGGEGGGGIF